MGNERRDIAQKDRATSLLCCTVPVLLSGGLETQETVPVFNPLTHVWAAIVWLFTFGPGPTRVELPIHLLIAAGWVGFVVVPVINTRVTNRYHTGFIPWELVERTCYVIYQSCGFVFEHTVWPLFDAIVWLFSIPRRIRRRYDRFRLRNEPGIRAKAFAVEAKQQRERRRNDKLEQKERHRQFIQARRYLLALGHFDYDLAVMRYHWHGNEQAIIEMADIVRLVLMDFEQSSSYNAENMRALYTAFNALDKHDWQWLSHRQSEGETITYESFADYCRKNSTLPNISAMTRRPA